ncbi:MAG: lipoprotein signal peptidase [Candidatus Hydrogenedentota bacterium]
MKMAARIALVSAVLVSMIGCDQATKHIAQKELQYRAQPITFAFDTFRLQYAENKGAFLSLGSTLPPRARYWVFVVFTSALLVGLTVYLFSKRDLSLIEVLALALLLSGGIGNLIDRTMRGGIVVDFMNMGIGSLRTGIFNVADTAVMAGIFLLIGAHFFDRKQESGEGNETSNA